MRIAKLCGLSKYLIRLSVIVKCVHEHFQKFDDCCYITHTVNLASRSGTQFVKATE